MLTTKNKENKLVKVNVPQQKQQECLRSAVNDLSWSHVTRRLNQQQNCCVVLFHDDGCRGGVDGNHDKSTVTVIMMKKAVMTMKGGKACKLR